MQVVPITACSVDLLEHMKIDSAVIQAALCQITSEKANYPYLQQEILPLSKGTHHDGGREN